MSGACSDTRGERLADGVVHAVALTAALTASAVLLFAAHQSRAVLGCVVAGLYVAGLLGMLGTSALYHLTRAGPLKALLRRLDHAAIFLMIAGTYTPVIAWTIPDGRGWALLAVVWMGAAAGASLKLLAPGRFERLAIVAYLSLGWAGLAVTGPLLDALKPPDIILLAAGGVLYSLGLVAHLSPHLRYRTAIWHLFVLVAAACHFVAIHRLVPVAILQDPAIDVILHRQPER